MADGRYVYIGWAASDVLHGGLVCVRVHVNPAAVVVRMIVLRNMAVRTDARRRDVVVMHPIHFGC